MQNERATESATGSPGGGSLRSRSPVSQRELDIASARALQQEVRIAVEPNMPPVVDILNGSPRLRPAKKRVHSIDDLRKFLESTSAREFLGFILSLGEAVKGVRLTDDVEISEPVQRLLDFLAKLSSWIDEIPPHDQTMRYGNIAFRDWHDRLEFSNHLVEEILGEENKAAYVELAPYLYDSFGNKSRIDYGTGHETNFFAFLFCLAKLGIVGESDRVALMTYGLEPAGSHGVWGLDDYQFLSFLLGAAQLINHPSLTPASITNDDDVHANESHFMFFGCVSFVRKVKKGPLAETSPYLFDTSKVPTWTKIYGGLIKMYQGELLCKFPIMQHFLFGRLIVFPE